MNDLTIVIPIGVSTPGTPVIKYLKWCIESFKNQKTKYKFDVVFACDDNVSDEVKQILVESNYKVSWYDSYYFFRKGSIWKKIFDEWGKSESKYVAFCHYDDVWSDDKVENQIDHMMINDLECSWSCVKVIDENNKVLTGDVSSSIGNSLSQETVKLGGSYAFSHSTILDKNKFLNCGIEKYIDISAAVYESLHFVFCHKLKNSKNNNSIFFHRIHTHSVSNNLNRETKYKLDIAELVNYSSEQLKNDTSLIDIDSIIKGIYTE